MEKKIVFLNTSYLPNVGGAENSIFEMSSAAYKLGYLIDIICSDKNAATDEKLESKTIVNERTTIKRYSWTNSLKGYLESLQLIKSSIADGPPYLMISRSHILVIIARLAGARKVAYLVPSVYFFQEKKNISWRNPRKLINYIGHSMTQWLAFLLSDVFVFSNAISQQVSSASLKFVQAKQVFPGINTERFFPLDPKDKQRYKESAGWSDGDIILLCLGRFVPLKQFHLAIGSLQFLPENYKLCIVGSGPEHDNYVKLIENLNLASRIKIYPATNSPTQYYHIADYFMMTSYYETFGQVVLEAIASGLRVVAFNRSAGVNTAVQDILSGHDGLVEYASKCSPDELAKSVTKLKESNFSLSAISAQRMSVLAKYSWQNTLRDIKNFLA